MKWSTSQLPSRPSVKTHCVLLLALSSAVLEGRPLVPPCSMVQQDCSNNRDIQVCLQLMHPTAVVGEF